MAQRPPTNLETLSRTVYDLVGMGMDTLRIESGDSIVMKDSMSTSLSRFVMDRFYQGLIERGVRVYSHSSTDSDVPQLSIVVSKAQLEYDAIRRCGIFGRREIDRFVAVALSLRVTDHPSQRIKWAGELVKHNRDRVPFRELPFIEDGELLLGEPGRPPKRGLFKWIEPSLMIAATIGVAYLFYTVRSPR